MMDAAPTARDFPERARDELGNARLQGVLSGIGLFLLARKLAVGALPEFEALRDDAKRIKDHTLAHLDAYLETFESQVIASGGRVHWARTADEACTVVSDICHERGARKILKGKSMVTEEIGLNDHLARQGLDVLETRLGDYITLSRNEPRSHIVPRAMHVSQDQVAETFRDAHGELSPDRTLDEAESLLAEAREVLREHFFSADVGITGANFLVAETGSAIVVTNEGNGDLAMTLPACHIVVASIDKLVPTLHDATTLLRVLSRSVTGQDLATYTTFATGPRRDGEDVGPEAFHVVLVDAGRSHILGTEFRAALRCIRCSACMNHCPVFGSVGGHAYGAIYPGPIGAVLNPALSSLSETQHLPNATSVCGRCDEVCPVRIPLTDLMRAWRRRAFARALTPLPHRVWLGLWAMAARRPPVYRALTRITAAALSAWAGRRQRLSWLPFLNGWAAVRDLPAPEGRTFLAQWRARRDPS